MIDNREEFRNIANATEQMTTAFADFLTALLKRQGFIEDFDAYDIVKYVSEGGSTIQTCKRKKYRHNPLFHCSRIRILAQ